MYWSYVDHDRPGGAARGRNFRPGSGAIVPWGSDSTAPDRAAARISSAESRGGR